MSIFSKILDKLGFKKPAGGVATPTPGKVESKPSSTYRGPGQTAQPGQSRQPGQVQQPVQKPGPSASTPASRAPGAPAPTPTVQAPAAKPAPMEMVDVRSKLESMAEGTNLDWKVSIVDLLKILGIDSSLQARKELATELGATQEIMQDNVKMNVWLHKTVLAKIAENGGNVPKELLD